MSWEIFKTILEKLYSNAAFISYGFPVYTQILCTDTLPCWSVIYPGKKIIYKLSLLDIMSL